MFIATLFIIVKKRTGEIRNISHKQENDQVNWYMHTME